MEALFNKVIGLKTYTFIKKELQHRCFPMNIVKFTRTPILKNTLQQRSWHIKVLWRKFVNSHSGKGASYEKSFPNQFCRWIRKLVLLQANVYSKSTLKAFKKKVPNIYCYFVASSFVLFLVSYGYGMCGYPASLYPLKFNSESY